MRGSAGRDAGGEDVWVHGICHAIRGCSKGFGKRQGSRQLAPCLLDCSMDPVPCFLFRHVHSSSIPSAFIFLIVALASGMKDMHCVVAIYPVQGRVGRTGGTSKHTASHNMR